MKKLLGLILVFSMLASLLVVPVNAASGASVDASREEALLADLGVTFYGADLQAKLTRGEFANYICKLLNIVEMPAGYKLPYTDVPETHQYYKGIYNIYAWRLISDSQAFRPDDLITVNEAAKIVVSALGYDFLAIEKGGYPGGYIAAATQLGIMPKGVDGGITRASAYVAMYKMLHTNLSMVNIGTNGNNEYKSQAGDTLLGERWNISYDSGVVEDGQYYGINYEDGVGEGNVVISGIIYKSGSFDTDSWLGEEVDVYYNRSNDTIASIFGTSADSDKVKTIFSSQDISYNDRTYKYVDGEKDKEIKISKSCVIIYNGKRIDFDKNLMVPSCGSVKLICSGNEADIVVIKSYIQAVVGAINSNDKLVSDRLNPGTSYVFDDDDTVYIDQNGNVSNFESIAENDVLWIAQNTDGEYTDIIMCRDYIEGQLTGTSSGSDAVYIDGRKFDATSDVIETLANDYQIGSIIKALINPDGNIIWIISQNAGSSEKVGYLMYSKQIAKGLSYDVYVKILGTDNAIVQYKLAPKFLLNGVGVSVTNSEEYMRLPLDEFRNLSSSGSRTSMKCSIITFIANAKNEISAINYPSNVDVGLYGAKNIGLFPTHSITDTSDKYVQFIGDDRIIVNKGNERIFVNSSMPTRFYVPMLNKDNTSPEDEYYKYQTYPKGYQVDMKHFGYTRKENSLMSDYIVTEYPLGGASGETIPKTETLYMVKAVDQIIDDEGMPVERVVCQTAAGVERSFYSKELGYVQELGLEFGDLIKVSADIKKNLEGIQLIYKAGDTKLSNTAKTLSSSYSLSSDGSQLNADSGMGTLGYLITLSNAYRSDGTFFDVLMASDDIDGFDPSAPDAPKLYCYSASRKTITAINVENETYTIGGGELIKGYYDFGNQCSTVVAETYAGSVRALFVYEK